MTQVTRMKWSAKSGQPQNLPKNLTPVDKALVDAAKLTLQKVCPHETIIAGCCIVCDKMVRRR